MLSSLRADVIKSPQLQTLHALRIGLCVKIRRGELSVKQGTEIFEKARQALLMERQAATPTPSSKLLKP